VDKFLYIRYFKGFSVSNDSIEDHTDYYLSGMLAGLDGNQMTPHGNPGTQPANSTSGQQQ